MKDKGPMLACVMFPARAPNLASARLALVMLKRNEEQKNTPPVNSITTGVARAAVPQPRYCTAPQEKCQGHQARFGDCDS